MMLALAALVAQAPPASRERPVVDSVEVRLPSGADPHLLERVADLVVPRAQEPLRVRAVRESIRNLYATGRFSDVVVLAEGDGERVKLVFELSPRRRVAALVFGGAGSIPDAELRELAGLRVGSEYWPEDANEAAARVRDAYVRRGYLSARVEPRSELVDGRVEVSLLVDEGAPVRVRSVVVSGEPGLSRDVVLDAVQVPLGALMDEGRLVAGAEALRARLRRERFYRARVEAPTLHPDGRVEYVVDSGPRIDLRLRGHRSFGEGALRAVLAYDGAEALDRAQESRLAQRLEAFYRFRGFPEVRVTPSERAGRAPGETIVELEIEEGPALLIEELAFDGNAAIGDDALRDVVTTALASRAPRAALQAQSVRDPLSLEGRAPGRPARSEPRPPLESVFDLGACAEAAAAMLELYRGRGFLQAAVTLQPVEVRATGVRVRYLVEEGPRARVERLTVEGAPEPVRLLAAASLPRGAGFTPSALEDLRRRLEGDLGRIGHLFATVSSEYEFEPGGAGVHAIIRVEPGPKVRTRRVLTVGAERTREEVILGQAAMVEGEPLSADALFATQSNLMQLGAFRAAAVEMLSPEVAEPLKTVVLRVRERPRLTVDPAVGYFLAEGPRVVGDFSAPNLWGRALALNGHVLVNYFGASVPAITRQLDVSDLGLVERLGGRGNVSIQNRGLLPFGIGLRADVVGERVFRPSFRFTRYAGGVSVDWSAFVRVPFVAWTRPKLTLQLHDEVDFAVVERTGGVAPELGTLSLTDQERLRFLTGAFLLNTVRFAPTVDLRDDALTPRRGLLLQGSAEVSAALSTADEQGRQVPMRFAKVSGLVTVYFPVSQRASLAASLRGGRILPLVGGSVTPPVRRFFMGGSNSLRGFGEDQLVAQELRERYRADAQDCLALASRAGCTPTATLITGGRQVPSQGGEAFLLGKLELRAPAAGGLELGLFAEAGNLWLSTPESPWPLRTVVGAGLRYPTPIGPIAFDLGVNVQPDLAINEPRIVAHFNIGTF